MFKVHIIRLFPIIDKLILKCIRVILLLDNRVLQSPVHYLIQVLRLLVLLQYDTQCLILSSHVLRHTLNLLLMDGIRREVDLVRIPRHLHLLLLVRWLLDLAKALVLIVIE